MSDPYSIKVGRDDEFVRGRGIQQFTFTKTVQKTNPFSLYVDHGALSDYIEMGMLVNLYHNQERIFKGRILGFDEDDDGISIGGNDMMVAFPNVFVDLEYDASYGLKKLIYDVMHSISTQRHVDHIDAETFVRSTNLERQWIINDKPLMTLLNDLVPSSQDPSSYRRNTFFLDPYDNFYVEPIGGGGEFRGAIDLQKRKMGCKVDGNFCNYAVYRGVRAIPYPANRDSWTENNASVWDSVGSVLTDSTDSQSNLTSLHSIRATPSYRHSLSFEFDEYKSTEGYEYVNLWFKMKAGPLFGGQCQLDECYFRLYDVASGYIIADAFFDDNVSGITSVADDTWYQIRIPLNFDAGPGNPEQLDAFQLQYEWTVSTEDHESWTDGLFLDRAERVSTQMNADSIKTFGLFEKRKRDTNLWYTSDCVAAAQALLNPYPKMNYNITARGYVPIRLNQTIGVRWKEVDWVLPLTQNRMTLKAGVTTSHLTFGGMPLSADDVNNALAAENRAETYGRVVRHNKGVDSGDDPLNHETAVSDDAVPDLSPNRWGLESWKGKSGVILSPTGRIINWGDFNQYDVIPI